MKVLRETWSPLNQHHVNSLEHVVSVPDFTYSQEHEKRWSIHISDGHRWTKEPRLTNMTWKDIQKKTHNWKSNCSA